MVDLHSTFSPLSASDSHFEGHLSQRQRLLSDQPRATTPVVGGRRRVVKAGMRVQDGLFGILGQFWHSARVLGVHADRDRALQTTSGPWKASLSRAMIAWS